MNEYTREKIIVLGSKSPQCRCLCYFSISENNCHACFTGNWKEDIQKYISPDQLIEAYGGTRCEPDPWCTDYVSPLVEIFILVEFALNFPRVPQLNPGYDVPPEYYLMNLMETNKENMQRTTVRRASEHLVNCAVEEPKSVLRCGLTKMLLMHAVLKP